jgi:hypothetical protein
VITLPPDAISLYGKNVVVNVNVDDSNLKNRTIPNAELREAMDDIRLKRNLHGPFVTAKEAVHPMLED